VERRVVAPKERNNIRRLVRLGCPELGGSSGAPPGTRTPNRCLREPASQFLDLRRLVGACSDLGVWLLLLSVGDPWLPTVRGPSWSRLGHGEGTAGEGEAGSEAGLCQLRSWR
jgi:hypothetical protein